MLLVQTAKSSIAAVLSKALATYLHVDTNDIDSKLLAGDGGIVFHNVEIREQIIPLSIQDDNLICSMVLYGTVQELSLNWTWSSVKYRLLEDSNLTIKGLHLKIHYRYAFGKAAANSERTTRRRSSPTSSSSSAPPMPDPAHDQQKQTPPKKENIFTSHLKEEFQRLQKAVISNIKESQFVKQAIQDVIDSFSLRIDSVVVDMLVPFTGQTIEAGFDNLHFDSMLAQQQNYSVRPAPLMLDLAVKNLYANLKDSFDSMPILEPFTYRTTARRFHGTRFLNMQNGYEIIGSSHQQINNNPNRHIDNGILLHYTEPTWGAIQRIQKAWCGKPLQEPDYDAEIYNCSNKDTKPHPWPVSAKVILWFLGQLVIASTIFGIRLALLSFHILQQQQQQQPTTELLVFWIIGGVLSLIATVYIMFYLDLNPIDDADRIRTDQEKAIKSKKKLIHEQPATFRLPLPFITVYAPDDVRLNLTGISVVGQIDGSYIYGFAEGLDVTSKGIVKPGPHVLVSGIRASYVQQRVLVNIDVIDALFIPDYFRLAKALECTVIRFEEGRMKIKLRSLKGWILTESNDITEPAKVTEISEDDFSLSFRAVANKMKQTGKAFETTGKVIKKTGKAIDEKRKLVDQKFAELHSGVKKGMRNVRLSVIHKPKLVGVKDDIVPSHEAAKNRMNAELYEYLVKLQRIAAIFEKIPVQNNRENLRLYPSSFRGSEGVDFLLENNMAESREEAIKLLQDFEVEFNLFQSVTKEYKFHDDYHCLFRFVDPSQRRNWTQDDLPYDYIENFDREPVPSPLPFPIAVFANTVVLHKSGEDDGESFQAIRNARIFLDNGKLSRSIQFTVFAGLLKTYMMALTNGRIHGLIHPDVPKLIHRLQFSVDRFLVNPEFSVEDWLEKLGFVEDSDNESDDEDDEYNNGEEKPKAYSSFQEPYSLPHAFVSQFSLILSYSGPVLKAKEALIRVDPFVGNASTTSNDLIKEFVVNVLGRAPTVLSHLRFMGVSPAQSTGIGLVMNVGAKWVPLGQYLVIGAMAIYDGVCVAIDTGKAARHDPTGHHHSGDFFRGLWALGGETARHGAQIRGKTDDDYYDENDHVKLDPLDFAVGVTHGMGGYANKNKAKFAGAYVAAAVMIGTTVAFGPLGGIVAGVIAGAGTEAAVKKIERRFGNKEDEEDEDLYDDIDKEE